MPNENGWNRKIRASRALLAAFSVAGIQSCSGSGAADQQARTEFVSMVCKNQTVFNPIGMYYDENKSNTHIIERSDVGIAYWNLIQSGQYKLDGYSATSDNKGNRFCFAKIQLYLPQATNPHPTIYVMLTNPNPWAPDP